MKFSHRLIALSVAGCFVVVYFILLYSGLLPTLRRDENKALQLFLQDNPLVFSFNMGRSDQSQCRADFYSPEDVRTTLELAEKTDYNVYEQNQYHIPHLSLEDAAYRKNLETLNVIILPHSHVDPGWLETVDEYYHHKVEDILNNMVKKLHLYPDMTFIWAEIVFFSKWWEGQNKYIREQVKDLIHSERLEIVLGGWVMPDEASTLYSTVIDQLIEGHQWVYNNLGVKPKNSWSVDPFGHSGTMPYLWKKSGIKNMVIQRIHQGTKAALAFEGSLEFTWKQYWDDTGAGDIRCHVMPYMLYSLFHTCGPSKFVCSQYDFKRIPGEIDFNFDNSLDDSNLAKRAQKLYEQYRLKGSLYKHNTILVPLGDDFRYNHHEEWDQQYENYKKLMRYMNNKKDWKINVRFGTVNDYFEIVQREQLKLSHKLPIISGDFFPYSDQNKVYWTGYFTTRPFDKRFSREVEARLRTAEFLTTLALSHSKLWNKPYQHSVQVAKLQEARQELGLFLHHDAITGTSKGMVVKDYEDRLYNAFMYTGTAMEIASQYLLTDGKLDSNSILQPELVRDHSTAPAMHQILKPTKDGLRVVMVNPTGQVRSEFAEVMVDRTDIEIRNSRRESVPFQINPVFQSDTEVHRKAFEIVFQVEIPPFGIETYILITINRTPKSYWSNIKIYNTQELIVPPELLFGQEKPRRRGNLFQSIYLENENMNLEFRSVNGLLSKVTDKKSKKTTMVNVEFKYYVSRGSGAYTFFPDGPAKDQFQGAPIIRVIEGPYTAEVQVLYPYLFHKTRLYKHPGIQGRNVHIQNGLDMQAVNMREREVIMRLATSVNNKVGDMFTDENGFQIIGRKKNPDDKRAQHIERNYYPVTTMAFIQDKSTRLTLHTGQPHGTASLDTGWLEVMLDRQLLYDDDRGLGEGVYDNKLTLSKFVLQIEYPEDHHHDLEFSYPSLHSILANDFLQHPLQKMYSTINTDVMKLKFSPLKHSLPCDTTIVSLRTMFNPDDTYKSTSLVMHKRGYRCGFPDDKIGCTNSDISLQGLFPGVTNNKVEETSLTHLYSKPGSVDLARLHMSEMDIKAYMIKLEPKTQ